MAEPAPPAAASDRRRVVIAVRRTESVKGGTVERPCFLLSIRAPQHEGEFGLGIENVIDGCGAGHDGRERAVQGPNEIEGDEHVGIGRLRHRPHHEVLSADQEAVSSTRAELDDPIVRKGDLTE